MNIVRISRLGILIGVVLFFSTSCNSDESVKDSSLIGEHPCLILTKGAVNDVKQGVKTLPLMTNSFNNAQSIADKAIAEGVVVPFPADPGGGYTHEQHKRNYKAMYNAGVVYQINGDEKYATFVKEMLEEYAQMYPTLGIHPHKKNQAPGKLFWQGLNESVWLVYTIQAYDCIYEYLSQEERDNIEENLFRKMVEFFTIEDSYSFNRVHNHGTWAAAGVGMTGMVLGDTNYVEMALYDTEKSGKGGFLKQITELFSPDGFYTEGPYYQRYAIHPFIVFAQSLENNRPDIKIFEHKGGVLNKAVYTLLQLSAESGKFYPLNDAIKDKDYLSPELIFATNIAYSNTANTELLSIAQKHGTVMMSAEGLKVAKDIEAGKSTEFVRKPMFISDGANGDLGGIGLLRGGSNGNNLSILLKATSQGMGHGHFDRLAYLMYENGEEIIQDYGAARFLNIEEKHGGRYLPENNKWAKQTVAHNTVVINQKSNFNSNLKEASKYNPNIIYTNFDKEIQVAAVADSHCYKPNVLQRTMALVEYKNTTIIVDLFRVLGTTPSTYDLPIYYQGQFISSNIDFNVSTKSINVMKGENGYQFLWNLAASKSVDGTSSVTWKNGNRFYTFSSLLDKNSTMYVTKIGANDPEFNLRNEPGLLVRQERATNHTFLSALEAHGKVDPVNETVEGTKSIISEMAILKQTKDATAVKISLVDESSLLLVVSHANATGKTQKLTVNGKELKWTGNYYYEILDN